MTHTEHLDLRAHLNAPELPHGMEFGPSMCYLESQIRYEGWRLGVPPALKGQLIREANQAVNSGTAVRIALAAAMTALRQHATTKGMEVAK